MTHEILKSIDENNAKPGWAVFHFSPASTIWAMVWKIIFIALCGIAGYMFAFMETTLERSASMRFFAVGFGIVGLLLLLGFLSNMYRLISGHKTVIVITGDMIVKSYCGRVEEYPLGSIKNLKFIQTHGYSIRPRGTIQFTDARNGKNILLATGRIWGDENNIFAVLSNRIETGNSSQQNSIL